MSDRLPEIALRKLESAPEAVIQVVAEVADNYFEVIVLSTDASDLADAYVREGAIGDAMRADALH